MKRFFAYLCLFVMAATLLAAPSALAKEKEVLTISTGEWPPWTGAYLRGHGAVLDIVRQAFARRGYDVRFEFYTWQRAFELMALGEVNASAYWYHRDKYDDIALFSAPLNMEEHVFVHLRSKEIKPWKTLEDLAGYRIGAAIGLSYSDEFWRLAEEGVLNVQAVLDDELNMKKLLDNRIDMYPVTRSMMEYALRDKYRDIRDKVAMTKTSFCKSAGHLLFPRERPESKRLCEEFNAGLNEILQDGTLEMIMKRLQHGYYDPKPGAQIK